MAIDGLRIGHAADADLKSGTTVFLADPPAIAAIHVAGGAPATRETDLLTPGNLVEHVDAIVLSGGSAFGLAAADGVMSWLAAAGLGFPVAGMKVPIVPAACLFDLANGGDKSAIPGPGRPGPSPYFDLGRRACDAATDEPALGSVGAGTGATLADLKGGFGIAEAALASGGKVAAFVAVNAVGRATFGDTPFFRAAPLEQAGEFGGLGLPAAMPPDASAPVTKRPAVPAANTTIAVVTTDLDLTRGELRRVAIAAHDGMAMSLFPAHTALDGDTVFALATGRVAPADRLDALVEASAAAAATLARAIARAVHAAEPAPGDGLPTWRQRHAEWHSRL